METTRLCRICRNSNLGDAFDGLPATGLRDVYRISHAKFFECALSCDICEVTAQHFLANAGPQAKSKDEAGAVIMASIRKYNGNCQLIFYKGSHVVSWMVRTKDAAIDPNPLSEKSFDRMQAWTQQCDSKHDHCKKPEPTFMPKRLLDVGRAPSQSVRLVLSADPKERYIALSHCWGASPPVVTTSKNICSFQAKIIPSSLPRTFSDAVKVTRLLGIRYLWIDSLCIVQDDPKDWLRESAMMASVYGNADITIVASKSSSSAEGFLSARHETYILKKETNASGQEVELYLVNREYYDDCISRASRSLQEPLSKRAWAVQERHLSRRKIIFTKAQMFWECNQMTESEDTLLTLIRRSQGRHGLLSSLSWYDIVESFMNCSITYETDTLPAISGIAKTIARTTGGIYCAGIWTNRLCNSLLWYPQGRGRGGYEVRKIKRRTYVAPSFSWAASQGPIWHTALSRTIMSRRLCEYVAHGQTLRTGSSDPYGAIESAWITLTAPLIQIFCIGHRDQRHEIDLLLRLQNGEVYVIPAIFDHKEAKTPTDAFLLPLYYDEARMQALLLIRAPYRQNHMRFSRIGICCALWTKYKIHTDSYPDTLSADTLSDSLVSSKGRKKMVKRIMSEIKGPKQTVVLV